MKKAHKVLKCFNGLFAQILHSIMIAISRTLNQFSSLLNLEDSLVLSKFKQLTKIRPGIMQSILILFIREIKFNCSVNLFLRKN